MKYSNVNIKFISTTLSLCIFILLCHACGKKVDLRKSNDGNQSKQNRQSKENKSKTSIQIKGRLSFFWNSLISTAHASESIYGCRNLCVSGEGECVYLQKNIKFPDGAWRYIDLCSTPIDERGSFNFDLNPTAVGLGDELRVIYKGERFVFRQKTFSLRSKEDNLEDLDIDATSTLMDIDHSYFEKNPSVSRTNEEAQEVLRSKKPVLKITRNKLSPSTLSQEIPETDRTSKDFMLEGRINLLYRLSKATLENKLETDKFELPEENLIQSGFILFRPAPFKKSNIDLIRLQNKRGQDRIKIGGDGTSWFPVLTTRSIFNIRIFTQTDEDRGKIQILYFEFESPQLLKRIHFNLAEVKDVILYDKKLNLRQKQHVITMASRIWGAENMESTALTESLYSLVSQVSWKLNKCKEADVTSSACRIATITGGAPVDCLKVQVWGPCENICRETPRTESGGVEASRKSERSSRNVIFHHEMNGGKSCSEVTVKNTPKPPCPEEVCPTDCIKGDLVAPTLSCAEGTEGQTLKAFKYFSILEAPKNGGRCDPGSSELVSIKCPGTASGGAQSRYALKNWVNRGTCFENAHGIWKTYQTLQSCIDGSHERCDSVKAFRVVDCDPDSIPVSAWVSSSTECKMERTCSGTVSCSGFPLEKPAPCLGTWILDNSYTPIGSCKKSRCEQVAVLYERCKVDGVESTLCDNANGRTSREVARRTVKCDRQCIGINLFFVDKTPYVEGRKLSNLFFNDQYAHGVSDIEKIKRRFDEMYNGFNTFWKSTGDSRSPADFPGFYIKEQNIYELFPTVSMEAETCSPILRSFVMVQKNLQ